jgi:RimJ/RimL family protein N-acetyltransferase
MSRYAPMPSTLTTPRLRLRPREPSDAVWNIELVAEHDDGETRTLSEARSRLAAQQLEAAENGFGFLAIERQVEGDVIGYCGLLVGRASFDEPELAYELLRRFHGHGYATEAAAEVVAAAFATGRRRLWATVRTWNAPSFRVLAKLGFRRDHVDVDDRGEIVHLVLDAV